jgi:hypothetical protein
VKHKSLTATMALLGLALAFSVWGDTTTLTISNGSVTVTSNSSTTLDFPISRPARPRREIVATIATVRIRWSGTPKFGFKHEAASRCLTNTDDRSTSDQMYRALLRSPAVVM